MQTLAERKCVACRPGSPGVPREERLLLLPQLPEWDVVEREGVERLERRFSFPDFRRALDFAVSVGEIAEAEDHHPALLVEWGATTVTWWTHTVGGLHLNDFILAARTDQQYRDGG